MLLAVEIDITYCNFGLDFQCFNLRGNVSVSLQIGMQQSLELGQFIKRRYQNFLSEEYVIDEVSITS